MSATTSEPTLYYEERGSGEPLLMIVGFAVSSAVLDPLADAFAPRLRCITYDHPGTGRSSKRSFPMTTAALAGAAERVLDELGVESAHVAGISLGGVVAQELALRRPERVRTLVLMATSGAGLRHVPPDPRHAAAASARIVAGSVRRRSPWLGPAFFSPEFLAREPATADALLRLVARHPPAPWSVLGQWAAMVLHARDLRRIAVPTLVVHGDRDVAVPKANAVRLARAIPSAQLRILPGHGHGFQLERLPETVSMVCDWLGVRAAAA